MKKYYPVDFDEKGNAVLGRAKNTPTSNGFVPTTWAPGGSDEEKQGLKSITISPAITTTPALESLFPIGWDDLPEGEIDEGVEVRTYENTIHTGYALTNGAEYSVASTPSSEWHIDDMTVGDAGETVTTTATVNKGSLILLTAAKDATGTKCVSVAIEITE